MVILLVEDEKKLADNLKRGLEIEGYAVDVAYDGEAGLSKALKHDYDCIVLDILLPKKNGLEVCREIRNKGKNTPIIILSAKGQIPDKIDGLDSGADDYMSKPFGFDELLARIRSVLRRRAVARPTTLVVGDISLNPATHEVKRGSKYIRLTTKEFALLEYLMNHAGSVATREELLSHIWGTDPKRQSGNTLNVQMRYLRRKVDAPFRKKHIKTVRGVGYTIK